MTLKRNIEINQQPVNHTWSDEWLVSKETPAPRRGGKVKNQNLASNESR